jgi:hypothetical protein
MDSVCVLKLGGAVSAAAILWLLITAEEQRCLQDWFSTDGFVQIRHRSVGTLRRSKPHKG